LGNDANSVKLRNSLAQQYNNVLRQIDKLAQDSGYQGKNLLVGSGLRLDATASSKSAVNALTGISGARATNVVDADTYDVSVVGDGAITGNSNDIANAERDRGISNVEITGFASESAFNFNSLSIKLSGGTGKGQDLHGDRRLADLHADLHQHRVRCRQGSGQRAALLRQLQQRNAHQL
jgi:flagellin-like hook-associated protein FlgL